MRSNLKCLYRTEKGAAQEATEVSSDKWDGSSIWTTVWDVAIA